MSHALAKSKSSKRKIYSKNCVHFLESEEKENKSFLYFFHSCRMLNQNLRNVKFIPKIVYIFSNPKKKKTNLFYIFFFIFVTFILAKSKFSKRKIYSKYRIHLLEFEETARYRRRSNGSGYLSFPFGRHQIFGTAIPHELWIISWQTSYIPRGSSIFSLANFNESRIIEIPTISCNWQRIKLPHIRPSPRKRLLSLSFLENMDMEIKPKTLSVFRKKKNLFAKFHKKLGKKRWNSYSRYGNIAVPHFPIFFQKIWMKIKPKTLSVFKKKKNSSQNFVKN